jgi:hypothetical protein
LARRLCQHGVGLSLEGSEFRNPVGGQLASVLLEPVAAARAAVLGRGRVAEAMMAHGQEEQIKGVGLPFALAKTTFQDWDSVGKLSGTI